MSDPVKNADIEDVLSSIRRLVSEDARPRARAVEPPAPERLVLTPALRIDPEREAAALQPSQDEAQPEPEAQASEEASQDDHQDHDDAAVVAQEQSWDAGSDADQSGEEAQAAPQPDEAPHSADAQAEDDAGEEWSAEEDAQHMGEALQEDHQDDVDQSDETVSAAQTPEPHEAVFELLDKHLHEAPDQPEAAAEDDAAQADLAASAEPAQEPPEPEAEALPFADEALAWEDHVQDAPLGEDAEPLDQRFETKLGAVSPDQDAEDRLERSAHDTAWETETRDDAIDAAAMAAGAAAADLLNDESILDEETLREMVAEIVRQELQGALGERITRNVRKLVRREIHRALSSHEFE